LTVIRVLFDAELRRRWKSWLLVGVLVALVIGIVLAGVSAGRRTAAAFPQFVRTHGSDAIAYSDRPLPKMDRLPDVMSVRTVVSPATGDPSCGCLHAINEEEFSLYVAPTETLTHIANLVAGRMPDPSAPDQVLASFALQRYGVHVGTVFRVPLYTESQRVARDSGAKVRPGSPTLVLHVVGVEAAESELPGANGDPELGLYGTAALGRTLPAQTINYWISYVRLAHGGDDLPKFQSEAQALGALGTADQVALATAVASSIHPQAVGWWVLAALSALVGMVVVAQALTRQSVVESETHGVLRALGVTRHQMIVLGSARTLVIGTIGIVGGVALSFLLSPLTPVGEARLVESSRGFAFDPLVVVAGVPAALVLLVGLGLLADLRTVRSGAFRKTRPARPSRVVERLADAGAHPSVLIGVRRALERGVGRDAIPVGSAMLGSILAVAALCATAVFGASLNHLTSNPTLYGQPFDLVLDSNGSPTATTPMLSHLERIQGITGITGGIGDDVQINGKTVLAVAGESLRGPVLLTTVDGRFPHAVNEIALGATTMRAVHAHVGSAVAVSVPRPGHGWRTSSFRVVGTMVFPPDFGAGGLGTGAAFTLDGFLSAQCPPGPSHAGCAQDAPESDGGDYLLRFSRAADGRVARSRVAGEYADSISYPVTPANLVNFGEAVNFPLIFGMVLMVFAVATLVHVLLVSVVRRRREVGLLRALGFVPRQIAYSVWWQTTAITLVGLVIGVPAGIAAGRAVWQEFASSIGVLPVAILNPWVIVALVAGTFVVTNVLAIGPAVVAARARPASLLRSDS
jgi:hypothetical protein